MSLTPDFAAHRAAVLERLAPDEAVLVLGGPVHRRNGDADHRYRPQSDVYWLTGWPDPEVAVFLRPGDEPVTMFVQARNREQETWTGRRAGPEGAIADFGADAAFPYNKLDAELPRLLQGVAKLHYAFAADHKNDLTLLASISRAARTARTSGAAVPETFFSPSVLLHELRLHKNEAELAMMREAGRITGIAHRAAMALGGPGTWEFEIEAVIDGSFRRHGGIGPGYTSIVASGDNANILHYVTNQDAVADGDLVLVDAGCEFGNYTADVTRTWPVSGRFTEAQRAVYQIVLDAQLAAIDHCRVGNTFMSVHDVAVRVLTEGMVTLGLLEGEIDELIQEKTFKRYYMHGTSHWLGLDVHDVGTYTRDGQSRALAPGIVLTIEPGLYIPADDADAPEHLRGIGIRIEDDILVTDGDPEVLTPDIPKTVADVEAACARGIA